MVVAPRDPDYEEKLDRIFDKMTEDERWELLWARGTRGIIDGPGSKALERLVEYENFLIAKYDKGISERTD